MYVTRQGDLRNIKVRHEAQWKWARYLGESKDGKIYAEMDANAARPNRFKTRVGVSEDRVQWMYEVERFITETGGALHKTNRTIPLDLDLAREMRAKGWKYEDIGAEMGCSGDTIRKRLTVEQVD